MRPRAIELRIDELALHGVSAADRLPIARAFERELARLVADQGIADGLLDRPDRRVVEGGRLSGREADPAALGRAVARAVHEGLSR